MQKSNLILFILLIVQPIIDLITALSMRYQISIISLGAFARTMIMVGLFLYIFHYLFTRKKWLIWMFLASLIGILLMAVVNLLLKEPYHLFAEINFVLKSGYYVVIIYFAIILIENNSLTKTTLYQAAKIIAIIVGTSFWLALFTKTYIASYTYESVGYAGWFYSANELSVTVIILLGLTLIHLSHEKTPLNWIAFLFMLSMLPMIGTKTAFLGGALILFVYCCFLLLTQHTQIVRDKQLVLFFSIIVIFICSIPYSPIATNTKGMDYVPKQRIVKLHETKKSQEQAPSLVGRILSSRNIYFQATKADFSEAQGLRKTFGLGYAGSYADEPKTIEMDFFDLFFSFGIIGTLLLLLPLGYLCLKLIAFPLTLEKVLLLFVLGLCFGIAFLAGHVLFAPSVMTYMLILFLAISHANPKDYAQSTYGNFWSGKAY